MKLLFTLETDNESHLKSELIGKVTNGLSEFIDKQNLNVELDQVDVHLRILRTVKGFEQFFKLRSPIYRKTFKTFSQAAQEVKKLNGYFSYEVLITDAEYEKLIQSELNEVKSILGCAIIESLSNFDTLPKSAKNVKVTEIQNTVKNFFT